MMLVLGAREARSVAGAAVQVEARHVSDVSEVTDAARRAASLVTQALGVTLCTAGADEAPLVCGAPSMLAARLRSLMVEVVIARRTAWRGASDGGGLLEVRAEPAQDAPAWLRVVVAFEGATREVRLPIAGAADLTESGTQLEGAAAPV